MFVVRQETYLFVDYVCQATDFLVEFLNPLLNPPGHPIHNFTLKIGGPIIIIIRDLFAPKLCYNIVYY